MIYTQKPAAIGEVAVLVVDESAWQDGLEGAGGPITLALDTLQAADQVPGDPLNTQRLMFLRRRALRALQSRPDGPLRREWLIAAGFTPENAREAGGLEWMRKVDPGIHPLMTAAERRAAAKAAATNRTILRLAMFWRAIEALVSEGGPEASGWAALALKEDTNGSVRVIELKGRKPIREGWQAPTLILDALLNPDLVRPFWPQVEVTADVAAEAPHQRIYQVTDCSYSKLRLQPRDDGSEEDQRRRARNLRDLHAKSAAIGRAHADGRVLVVAQKAIEEALPALGLLPPSIELAHHNAIAGRDGWKDVTALVVVGRTAPSPANVERVAEALTGSAVSPLTGWYPRACTGRELANGAAMEAEADRHPDPIAEAVRWQICEGELVQIIGRARGVNRTAADPVNILVLTDVPLPLPVDGTLSQADLAPTPAELMLAAGGIAFENPADAAAAYPGVWATRGAAKIAFQRASGSRLDTNPNKESLIRVCAQPPCEEDPTLRRMDYQVSGPGRSAAVAWCDLAMVPNPVTALEEALGPLAWCRVAEPPVSPEPDPCPPDPPEQPEPKPEPPEPEPGLPPDLVFRRGVLEPPLVGVWAVRRPGLPAIRIGEQSSGSVLWVDSPQPASARSPFDVRPNPPGYEPIAPPIGIGADARFQAPGGAA
jgi:putative DNA primase/helicase